MTPSEEFDRLIAALEDWYSDSVKAKAFDADTGHASGKPGATMLRANRYPGPPWRRLWDEATATQNLQAQAAILRSLHDEIYGLTHSPSRAGPASGLHRGTQEWSKAIASAPGSLRQVARTFGVSHTEVRRQRLAHPQ